MRTEVHTITPEIARRLLAGNGNVQRPQRPSTVREYAEAMRQGRWQTTHQGVAVTGSSLDAPGALLDGQHRMQALVEAGVSIEMQVSFDLPDDMFNAIDIGATRSTADLLTIRGYKNSKHLVGIWKLAWCWERGRVSFSATKREDLIAGTLERYPSLLDIRTETAPHITENAPLNFILYITNDTVFAQNFLSCEVGTPAGTVANQLAIAKRQRKRVDRRSLMAMAVKARNDHEQHAAPPRAYSIRQRDEFPIASWNSPIPFDAAHAEDDE